MSQTQGELMDIAQYVRIFALEPDDDFVTKRGAAVKDLCTQFSEETNVANLMAIGSAVSEVFRDKSSMPDALQMQIESAIRAQSVSFVREGHELEIGVCGAVAATQMVIAGAAAKDNWTNSDVLAVALWSALSFLPACDAPKLEELRVRAIDAARSRIVNAGLKTRTRRIVPALGVFGDEAIAKETFMTAVAPAVDALRFNTALDREEINLLWWVLCGMSDIFDRPLTSLSPTTRAVATGIEIGVLMRALPSQSHRNLVMRGLKETESLTLSELLTALGEDRLPIAASFKDEALVNMAPLVFPLLSAIRTGNTNGSGAHLSKPLSDWGSRALLERAVLQFQHKVHREI